MALNKVKIIQRAVALLNTGGIVALSSDDVFTQSAYDTFDYLLESNIASADFRFATTVEPLTKLTATPPVATGYQFIMQLPARYITLVRLYPQTTDYRLFENKTMYTNNDTLLAEYRFVPDIPKLPGYYVDFFIHYLAATLAYGASSETLSTALEKKAADKYNRALSIEAKSRPNETFQSSPLTEVRGGGRDGVRII